MSEIKKEFVIFISGPSDVLKEKVIVKDIIESINKVLCPRLKIILSPRMGETHHITGVGRPQSKINPFVEDCDLLIIVFKDIFGTPTGLYDSGTEEEFKLSLIRYENSGSPEIIIFFKSKKNKETDKYEPQIRKLLKFKKDVRETLFYDIYKNNNELFVKVYEQIVLWLFDVNEVIIETGEMP